MMSINLGGMQSLSLLSGTIDYSQIITQLNQANRAPGDALNQVIQQDQLKQNDWGNISSLASKVQNDLVTLASSATFSAFSSTSTGTNSSDVTATAATNATPGTYNISITQQMKSSSITSGGQIGKAVSLSDPITSAEFDQPISVGTTLSVTIGTTTHSYTVQSSDTLNSIMSNLFPSGSGVTWQLGTGANADELQITNNSGSTVTFGSAGDTNNLFGAIGLSGVSVATGQSQYSGLLGHAQLGQTLGAGNFAQSFSTSGAGELDINGVAITYDTTSDTLQSVINSINSSSAGVTASYDPIQDKFTLTSKTSQPISVVDKTNNLGQVLGLTSASTVAPVTVSGQPWQYTINGGSLQTSASSSISNVIPGVTLNFQAPPNSINSTTTSLNATVTIAQDNSVLTKNVNTFVADFNNLYTTLQQLTGKGGDLQGDNSIAQLAFQYMNDVLGKVQTTTSYPQNTLMEIGITNGPLGSAPGTTNTLQVDTNALTTAFANNPSEVQALISGMANTLNKDLTNLTGQFNSLYPITSSNMNMQSVAQLQQNLYGTMIKDTEQQQQQIYDQADQEEQLMQQEFSQLQQFQQQSSMQVAALKGLFG